MIADLLLAYRETFGDDEDVVFFLQSLGEDQLSCLLPNNSKMSELEKVLCLCFNFMDEKYGNMGSIFRNHFWAFYYERGSGRAGFTKQYKRGDLQYQNTFDILSEALLSIIENRSSFEFLSLRKFDALVSIKMEYDVRGKIRKSKVRRRSAIDEKDLISRDDMLEEICDKEIYQNCSRALSRLTIYEQALISRRFCNCSYVEMQEEFGKSSVSLRQDFSRAMRRIREANQPFLN
jgi:DNA-directed RNA polymerase specialized sigma24 family protein